MDNENAPFYIVNPKSERVPFVLSIPHCGTHFPPELEDKYDEGLVGKLDDTDWYLDRLYDFAPELGVTVIYAKYSRWVIDLNRDPKSKPLYDDGRIITELCPKTSFLGENLYKQASFEPADHEIGRRLKNYYYPYHQKIDEIIEDLGRDFQEIVFWDGHSIRRTVKTIQKKAFPDFILGNNDRKTATDIVVDMALKTLRSREWQVNHNDPFKGGYLTRSKGNRENNVSALQLEMSKDLYMRDDETNYDLEKAEQVKSLLKSVFKSLISLLK